MDKKVYKLIKKINKYNDKDKVLLLGLSQCPFTSKSKFYLDSKNIEYKFYPIDKYRDIFFDLLQKINDIQKNESTSFDIDINHKTFPIIFIKNKFIGGYSDLIKFI